MSVWADIHHRSNGGQLRKEDPLKTNILRESAANTSLTLDELLQIEKQLKALHDTPAWYNVVAPPSFSWVNCGDKVHLSEERKTYLQLFIDNKLLPEREEDRDERMVKELGLIRVLGEYKEGVITLYISNIKDVAQEQNAPGLCGEPGHDPFISVVQYVYLHEFMHAFFDRQEKEGYEYNREKEEAFAEFGALLFLQCLVNTKRNEDASPIASKEELEWAIRHVERKKGVLECYSRGATLFKLFGQDNELAKIILESYPKALK